MTKRTNSLASLGKADTAKKEGGGGGFRDLHLFNIAMLARQAWKLLSNPDTICSQVLRARYAPNGDIKCRPKDGIPYTWSSILKCIELLNEGVIWRAGNGESVNLWNDPWIPHGHKRRPITRRGGSLLTQVSDLIDPVSGL
jgi:hypothetical protein